MMTHMTIRQKLRFYFLGRCPCGGKVKYWDEINRAKPICVACGRKFYTVSTG